MPIIDNTTQTMQQALINALSSAEKVDIEVAFFYFSGWNLIAEHLKDKKVRILVGKYIDPAAIPDLLSQIKQEGNNVDLGGYVPRKTISTRSEKKQIYIQGLTQLANESSLLDDREVQDSYKILVDKITDGSLEIKITNKPHHGKMYIIHKKPELNEGGDLPGTVFLGSSNFTFQGLLNQGELNKRDSNKTEYLESVSTFESHWKDSENIDIATLENKDDFLEKLKKELWIYANPSPYSVYVRVLHELFGKDIADEGVKTPKQITKEKYLDLEYQIDAIKSVLTRLDKYQGVILADVVGLGKSIIASAVAANIDQDTIIIAPPHLREQWDDYKAEFRLPAHFYSSGGLAELYNRYKNNDKPLLIIVDEAHRYRNEDTDDYRRLHHVCNSNPDNKVILLTATPFNNNPKDVFALIKLFQIPGQSDIRSVDNLSIRFRELIDRYRKLNQDRRSGKAGQEQIDTEADKISLELRRLIENVVIRRSRLDLRRISRYKEDLERQNIDFAEVVGPELLTYELGELLDLYLATILKITGEEKDGGFIGARYKPTSYILDSKRDQFLKDFGEDFDETDLKTAQANLAEFMKRLLVMRFESSKDAFRSTLSNMINSTIKIEEWWHKLGKVPIMKKGQIPDPDSILTSSSDDLDEELKHQTTEAELTELKESKGLIAVDKSFIKPEFIVDVKKDKKLLTDIYDDWYGEKAELIKDLDPKLDGVNAQIDKLLAENKDRKIVIFSTYADTVNYLFKELTNRGVSRILKYSAADSSKAMKRIVRENFDAGLDIQEQKNDFDVLIATDALSEGFNLHRAGVVINYDIPYNPTRVIQRVGRINRINKKMFDNIYIYNCFPTETGESVIRIEQISTLKIRLINAVVGSDTRTLTVDEKLESFFKDEYNRVEKENETETWDAKYKQDYDNARKDKSSFEDALKIKPRSRVIRVGKEGPAVVAFGKKGEHAIFALKDKEEPAIVASELALKYFYANKEEEGKEADKQYDEVFKLVRDLLFEKHPLASVRGRRADALKVVERIEELLPNAKDYCLDLAQIIRKYDGINEGDLKSISQLPVIEGNVENAFSLLKEIISEHQVASINERASRVESEYETILLSEDIRV